MFGQFDEYLLDKEYSNKQFDFITEAAQQEMVKVLKKARQNEGFSCKSPRYLVGETLIKIGSWLTRTPQLKEI